MGTVCEKDTNKIIMIEDEGEKQDSFKHQMADSRDIHIVPIPGC